MTFKLSRRTFLTGTAGAALSGALPMPAIAQKNRIRIGFIAPLSGPLEPFGRPLLTGAQLAVKQLNADGGIMGQQVDLHVGDDRSNPVEAVSRFKEISGKDIGLFLGPNMTGQTMAVLPLLQGPNVVSIGPTVQAMPFTHELYTPNFFRGASNVHMWFRALGRAMLERYPDKRKWAFLVPDNAFGKAAYSELREELRLKGGNQITLLEPIYTKFGQPDFKSEISRLMSLDADAFYCGANGADAVTFWLQAQAFGLGQKYQVIAENGSDFFLPRALKAGQPKMWMPTYWYYKGYDNPISTQLYKDYVAETGDKSPTGFVQAAHSGILAYKAAIEKAGSAEPASVRKALVGLSFDSAKGVQTFRAEDNQLIGDVEIMQVAAAPASEEKWAVVDHIRIDGATVIEPPSPGKIWSPSGSPT
jgi:branched-chain amino acid transport system substrate-binding protein